MKGTQITETKSFALIEVRDELAYKCNTNKNCGKCSSTNN